MEITQENVNDIEKWVESMRDLYIRKGLSVAAETGLESLSEFRRHGDEATGFENKTLAQLREEWQAADAFYRDARQVLNAGRQGG